MTTHRPERVADLIRETLARALLEEVRDPRIGFVTLTGVELTPDLKLARVYVSTLGPGTEREQSLAGLRRAAPFLRRTLARKAGLRFTPRLEFLFDSTLEDGSRVERLLSDLREEQPPDVAGSSQPESGEESE